MTLRACYTPGEFLLAVAAACVLGCCLGIVACIAYVERQERRLARLNHVHVVRPAQSVQDVINELNKYPVGEHPLEARIDRIVRVANERAIADIWSTLCPHVHEDAGDGVEICLLCDTKRLKGRKS